MAVVGHRPRGRIWRSGVGQGGRRRPASGVDAGARGWRPTVAGASRQLMGGEPIPEAAALHDAHRAGPGGRHHRGVACPASTRPTLRRWSSWTPWARCCRRRCPVSLLSARLPGYGQAQADCRRPAGYGRWALHHDRKAHAEDFVDDVSGTNGIAGAVDTLLSSSLAPAARTVACSRSLAATWSSARTPSR